MTGEQLNKQVKNSTIKNRPDTQRQGDFIYFTLEQPIYIHLSLVTLFVTIAYDMIKFR